MVSNIFSLFKVKKVLDYSSSNCSIGFFLVLVRCLIACCVEMYAKLLFEIKKNFQESLVLHTYPAFLFDVTANFFCF